MKKERKEVLISTFFATAFRDFHSNPRKGDVQARNPSFTQACKTDLAAKADSSSTHISPFPCFGTKTFHHAWNGGKQHAKKNRPTTNKNFPNDDRKLSPFALPSHKKEPLSEVAKYPDGMPLTPGAEEEESYHS